MKPEEVRNKTSGHKTEYNQEYHVSTINNENDVDKEDG